MEVIIELLGTTNNVIERERVNKSEITIGRGYHNDVIMADEHIDNSHLRLEQDDTGNWWLQDLNSLNGTKASTNGKKRHKIDRAQVHSGDIFIVGRNKIRILFSSHVLPAAVKIRRSESFLLWIGQVPILLLLMISYFSFRLLSNYLGSTEVINWSAVIADELQLALGVVVLAGLVYLLSILFKRGGNFWAHLSLLVLISLGSAMLNVVREIALFNFSQYVSGSGQMLQSISGYLILGIYLWCILYLAFHLSLVKRSIIAAAVLVMLVGLQFLQRDRFEELLYERLPVSNALPAPVFLLRKPTPDADYQQKNQALFERIEKDKADMLAKRNQS